MSIRACTTAETSLGYHGETAVRQPLLWFNIMVLVAPCTFRAGPCCASRGLGHFISQHNVCTYLLNCVHVVEAKARGVETVPPCGKNHCVTLVVPVMMMTPVPCATPPPSLCMVSGPSFFPPLAVQLRVLQYWLGRPGAASSPSFVPA
jgi:hypothetical protein